MSAPTLDAVAVALDEAQVPAVDLDVLVQLVQFDAGQLKRLGLAYSRLGRGKLDRELFRRLVRSG